MANLKSFPICFGIFVFIYGIIMTVQSVGAFSLYSFLTPHTHSCAQSTLCTNQKAMIFTHIQKHDDYKKTNQLFMQKYIPSSLSLPVVATSPSSSLLFKNNEIPSSKNSMSNKFSRSHNNNIFFSYSNIISSQMKGSVAPNNHDGGDTNTSIMHRIYKRTLARLWKTWLFRQLKSFFLKIFKSKNKTSSVEDKMEQPQSTHVETPNGDVKEKLDLQTNDNEEYQVETGVVAIVEDKVKERKEKAEEVTVSISARVSDIKQIEEDIVVVRTPEPQTTTVTETKTITDNKTHDKSLKSISQPNGERWAVSSPNIDLSGTWKIVVDDKFKEDYDLYLKNLGQPSLVRSIAVSIVEMTTEEVIQGNEGRSLSIKGKNLRGVWDRTLMASGSDFENDFNIDSQDHDQIDLITADKEEVKAESWWEENGTVHRSYLRGLKKYGGGDFESRRYLEDDGNTLICESVFHPKDGKQQASITWKFRKI